MKKIRLSPATHKVNRSFGGTFGLFLFIAVIACFMALPMVLIISNSFKPLDELWAFPPKLFPVQPTLRNYSDMMDVMADSLVPFTRYLSNTVFITAVGTAGHIILSSMCAFVFAKKRFPGRKLMFETVVLTLMFNATVTAIPNYLVMAKLNWINTLFSIAVPALASPLGLYLMKQFMEQSIPDALIEAARVDGASQFRIFWRIVMPNVKPAWLTLMLLSVQSLWNVSGTTYIFSDEKKTLAYALHQITTAGIARAGVSAAVSVVLMSVPIGIFLFSQSKIIETMAASGMKD